MSTHTWTRWNDRAETYGTVCYRWLFGDRIGATIFLGALLWFVLYWRVEPFSNDNYANLNALVNLAHGHLYLDQVVFGPSSAQTPGVRYADGQRFTDNYGIVTLSLPAYFLLRALDFFTDLRVAFAAAWSFGLLALSLSLGSLLDRRRVATIAGSALALSFFVANVSLASPFPTRWLPMLALQSTTAIAGGLTGVIFYRLLTRLYDRRIGVTAGVAAVVATPIGFWSVVPKQHAITALFVTLTLYSLYRSRETTDERERRFFRALSYAWVGLTAWQHTGEALILFLALTSVDLLTARRTDAADLVAIVVALGLSSLPVLATNTLVVGNPFQPLKLLPAYHGQPLSVSHAAGSAGSSAGHSVGSTGGHAGASGQSGSASSAGSSGGSQHSGSESKTGFSLSHAITAVARGIAAIPHAVVTSVAALRADLAPIRGGVSMVSHRIEASVDAITQFSRVRHVFFRSGYESGLPVGNDVAVNLSVLESMPLLGSLFAVPAIGWRFLRDRRGRPSWTPERVLDAFALVYASLLVAIMLPLLPLHHMITARYLHGLYPLGLYGLFRLGAIRGVVHRHRRLLSFTYVGSVVLGCVLFVAAIVTLHTTLGESVQLYGLVAFVVGVGTIGWGVAATVRDRHGRSGAVVLGVAAASATVFLLVGGIVLFSSSGRFVLPISHLVSHAFTITTQLSG